MRAITETYQDIAPLVKATAWWFTTRCGGDINENLAEARLLFIQAYRAYGPQYRGGNFRGWVRQFIWHRLTSKLRQEERYRQRRNGHGDPVRIDLDRIGRASHCWDLLKWQAELSEDARTVLRLALDPPMPLHDLCEPRKGRALGPVARARLKRHLTQRLGWSSGRIVRTFTEIGTALRD